MNIIKLFKRSKGGFMNKIEYHEAEGYIRKSFHNSFLENCYTDFLTAMLGFTMGVKIKSGKNRQYTEAKYLKTLHGKGFPVPGLVERGKGYNDIEYLEMKGLLSNILGNKDVKLSEKKKYLKDSAAIIRKMHGEGIERCDAGTHNIGVKPDGNIAFIDFEHESGKRSREKDISALAASAAFELDKPELVGEALKSIAEGYGNNLTQKIEIVPHAYLAFFVGNKLENLHELRKAIKYGIKK